MGKGKRKRSTRTALADEKKTVALPDEKKTVALLGKLFKLKQPAEAKAFFCSKKLAPADRVDLARLAGIGEQWCACDQLLAENVSDLSEMVVDELYKPFWFYRNSLCDGSSRKLFSRQRATRPLTWSVGSEFWSTKGSDLTKHSWLPSDTVTFESVVHFVQAGSGTGVHVGNGNILTCAHVVDSRDDDENEDVERVPARIGRRKIIMFASGRTFLATCSAVEETVDGSVDTACLTLGAEIWDTTSEPLYFAQIASAPVKFGEKLFCIGNPSQIDLESQSKGKISFEPPTFHISVGACKGYLPQKIHEQREKLRQRGRPPTRGELKQVAEAKPACADAGTYLQHTCWTYWGHSGAPLFDEHGAVTGLHCSWDNQTGMREGQQLRSLRAVLAKVSTPASSQDVETSM